MSYADRVTGTKVGFAYEQSGHFDAFARIRRQAERDAAEVRALVNEHGIRRAIGFSRGARAVVGALADGPDLFERVALVIPPGGTAAGKYSSWLESLPIARPDTLTGEILVIGNRGDQGHPARVAREWADQLGAHVGILPSRAVYTDVEPVATLLRDFFAS